MIARHTTLGRTLVYCVDWAIVIALGIAISFLSDVTPRLRPFFITNPSISFPFAEQETVPMSTLTVIVTVVPFTVMLAMTLLPAVIATVRSNDDSSRSAVWRHGIWEFHVNFLGLALSLALTIFLTEAMKNLFGKPRPDFLSRCIPDLGRVSDFVVGGFEDQVSDGQLVTRAICTQTDLHKLDDGLKSFPSGHSSGAAAGLLYLTLFLAGKFGVLPMVAPRSSSDATAYALLSTLPPDDAALSHGNSSAPKSSSSYTPNGPPLSLIIISLVPFMGAVYVAASRWFDFRHHPTDILFGFIMGMLIAMLSYRFSRLHLGPRTTDRFHGNPKAWGPARGSMAEEGIALNSL